jgi:hypothetical protein
MADTATSFHQKSRLSYGRLVVNTAPSHPVAANSWTRPEPAIYQTELPIAAVDSYRMVNRVCEKLFPDSPPSRLFDRYSVMNRYVYPV